jgi:hypothetical protein
MGIDWRTAGRASLVAITIAKVAAKQPILRGSNCCEWRYALWKPIFPSSAPLKDLLTTFGIPPEGDGLRKSDPLEQNKAS